MFVAGMKSDPPGAAKSCRAALKFAFAVVLGLLLPLAFSIQLQSFLLHQSAVQAASLYLLAAAVYSSLVLPAALILFVGALRGSRSTRFGVALSIATTFGTGVIGLGFILSHWFGSFGPSWLEAIGWRGTSLALLVALLAFLGVTRKQSPLHWLAAAITATLLPVGFALLAIASMSAVVGPLVSEPEDRSGAADTLSCSEARDRQPDVFLISIDALSARNMSLYGYSRKTTPYLSEFATTSLVFERAYSTSNFTTPAIASLLTGTRPWTHRTYHLYGMPLKGVRAVSLPALLRRCGYTTAAFVANGLAHPRQHGIAGAFDYLPDNYLRTAREQLRDRLSVSDTFSGQSLIDLFPLRQVVDWLDSRTKAAEAGWRPSSPEAMAADAVKFIGSAEAGTGSLFVWTHFYPPHDPYVPPAPHLGRFNSSDSYRTAASQDFDYGYFSPSDLSRIRYLEDRYDEQIAWMDRVVTDYLHQIEKLGRLENSIVVITADHGESFRHGYWGHIGPFLFEDLIHVPLIIRTPGQRTGRRIQDVVESIDVFPTIVDLIGGAVPGTLEGNSLVPTMEGTVNDESFAVAMQFDRSPAYGKPVAGGIAVVTRQHKFIRHLHDPVAGDELFDLLTDPGETENLASSDPEGLDSMQRLARPLISRHATWHEDSTPERAIRQ